MITEKYGRIIFLHIPRTGGMSLRNVMDKVYGDRVSRLDPWCEAKTLPKISPAAQSKHAFYGHSIFGMHKVISGPTSYITILREPAARLLSEYRRNNYWKLGLTLKQFAERVHVAFGFDQIGDNLQVRMLAGVSRGEKIVESHVYQALGIIREYFAYVGFTERYSDLVHFLRTELCWQFAEVPHINASSKDAVRCSEEEIEELKSCEQLKYDYMLWKALQRRSNG